jgi:site-specific DNA recombinase
MNKRRMDARATIEASKSECQRIDRDLERLVDRYIAEDDNNVAKTLNTRMKQLEARKEELQEFLANVDEPPPVLHPTVATVYRTRVAALYDALQQEASRDEAADIIRTLVNEITLTPEDGVLQVELLGDLAGILTIAAAGKQNINGRPDVRRIDLLEQVKMVAGARFELTTFRL